MSVWVSGVGFLQDKFFIVLGSGEWLPGLWVNIWPPDCPLGPAQLQEALEAFWRLFITPRIPGVFLFSRTPVGLKWLMSVAFLSCVYLDENLCLAPGLAHCWAGKDK